MSESINFKALAVDVGYDFVKVVKGSRGEDKLMYPSVVTVAGASVIGDYFHDKRFSADNMLIEFEGNNYYIGSAAEERGGERSFVQDKFMNPKELAKFLGGVYYAALEEAVFDENDQDIYYDVNRWPREVNIERLVVGLDIDTFYRFKDDYRMLFQGKSFDVKVAGMKNLVSLNINNVNVIAQGIGAYWNEVLDFTGSQKSGNTNTNINISNGKYGVVDIGGLTIDFFIAKSSDIFKETVSGSNLGLYNAFNDVAKSYEEEIPVRKIEDAFIKGSNKFYHNRERTLGNKLEVAFASLADSVYEKIVSKWNRHIQDIRDIYLCGGGANALKPYFDDSFQHKNIEMFKDQQYSNALGYYKIGMYRNKFDGNTKSNTKSNNKTNTKSNNKSNKNSNQDKTNNKNNNKATVNKD